jgi:hypothetical protein
MVPFGATLISAQMFLIAGLDIQFPITKFNLSEKQTTPKGWGAKPLA